LTLKVVKKLLSLESLHYLLKISQVLKKDWLYLLRNVKT